MTNHKAKDLLEKQDKGQISETEKNLLDNWYLQQDISDDVPGSNGILNDQRESAELLVRYMTRARKISLWPRIAAVAAAVTAITLCIWLYTSRHIAGSEVRKNILTYANDVSPGSNKATISIANGKTITLSDAKSGVVIDDEGLTYNDGTKLAGRHAEFIPALPAREAVMLTATTPRGGTYEITLPDGTHVWLNADSKISFPSHFSGKRRDVTLDGEAYFEVTHNEEKPFTVISKGQEVQVLGTHFNISSYADESPVKTTLLQGSVRVSLLQGISQSSLQDRAVILKPNQQAVLSNNNIAIKQVDPQESIDWKDGLFMFDTENLESIMKRVARWYNVEVIYTDKKAGMLPFSGSVSRFKNISTLLQQLESAGQVKFKIDNRTVIISSI